MDEAWRQKVRERAYAIWVREGSPEGQAEQFWLMAEEELRAEGQGPIRPSAAPAAAETSNEAERSGEWDLTTMGKIMPWTTAWCVAAFQLVLNIQSARRGASRPC